MSAFVTVTRYVQCHTCHQAIQQHDAQPIRLLLPTGRRRAGHEILSTNQLVHECNDCFTSSAGDGNEHLYVVHSCGLTRTVGAATPQEAAVLMLQDRGWRSTRSVAVQTGNTWTEYLDCQLAGGQLQYSEQVDLP